MAQKNHPTFLASSQDLQIFFLARALTWQELLFSLNTLIRCYFRKIRCTPGGHSHISGRIICEGAARRRNALAQIAPTCIYEPSTTVFPNDGEKIGVSCFSIQFPNSKISAMVGEILTLRHGRAVALLFI